MNLKGKNILIVGLARSGISASELVFKSGGEVSCVDKSQKALSLAKAEFEERDIFVDFREYDTSSLDEIDLVILSPGVNPNLDTITLEAKKRGVEVIGELELAFQFNREAEIIAVTGSNGKSTTTSLIGEMFKAGGVKTIVAGNIGRPYSDEVLDDHDIAVLEVSTFQTETMFDFSPDVGVLLNISPDHLDRHKTMDEYIHLKHKLFENMEEGDSAVLNTDDDNVSSLMDKLGDVEVYPFSKARKLDRGAWVEDKDIIMKVGENERQVLMNLEELSLKGPHNLENILASAITAVLYEIPMDTLREVLRTFKPLEHRLEMVRKLGDVEFYNDSKATNVESMRMALLSFEGDIVLIAGGLDKGGDFDSIRDIVKERVSQVVLIGDAIDKIKNAINGTTEIVEADDMRTAVNLAYSLTDGSGIVLLSPGCASFDMFENFEERGKVFKDIVMILEEMY